jgi:hypothetical protein
MNQPLARLALAATASVVLGCGGGAAYARKSESSAPVASVLQTVDSEGEETVVLTRSPGSAAAAQGPAATGGGATIAADPAVPVLPERLVVEGAISLEAEDPESTARELRAEVDRMGGRVVSEQVDGAAQSWRAHIRMRLPPGSVDEVVAWLERQGEVTSKRIAATDVSRALFDQEIALANLTTTLERLRKLLDGGGLSMQDILNVEKEMTRLRGEIERIKGDQRFLKDRVAFATLDVDIGRREGAVMSPRTKVYPGPRLSALTLFDADGREQTRLGAGFAMHLVIPRVSLEIDVFQGVEASGQRAAEDRAILATWGAGMYSDFLGRGRRRFLNPYLGFRLGYGYLGYHAFAVQGEAGVELFKHKFVMVDANVRATALIGDEVDAGLVSGGSIVFAF